MKDSTNSDLITTLAPCPDKPNCVSSMAGPGSHYIDPVTFSGTAESAMTRLQMLVATTPGATLTITQPGYIRAEYKSRLFGFVDDLELLLDEENNRFHIRSASRIGHYDFNANRKRVESLRKAFNSAGQH